MDTTTAEVIERVRKILAKTERAGCTPGEAEAAMAMASRLMTEHNLDMSEVEQAEDNTGSPSWIEDDASDPMGRWTLENSLAYGIVRKNFFVEGFFAWKNGKKVLRLFGQPHNVQTAKWMFAALIDAFDRLFGEYRKASGGPASDRRIFVSGVAQGFAEKMDEERKAMEIERDIVRGKTGGSTALAVRGIGEQTVAAYREAHPEFFKKNGDTKGSHRSSFAPVTGSNSALQAGHQAGRSLSLNRAVGGSSQRKLPGM